MHCRCLNTQADVICHYFDVILTLKTSYYHNVWKDAVRAIGIILLL